MTSKDPHLTKTRITEEPEATKVTTNANNNNLASSQLNSLKSDSHNSNHHKSNGVDSHLKTNPDSLDGTKVLDNDVYDSEHVKEGDNPARQPDRRDQQGETPFDSGVNDDTVNLDETPKSEELSERERYATIDNAQTRVLPTEEIKPAD